jgi:D-serine deaminase-like pyridoxal phosphate-dependent protein
MQLAAGAQGICCGNLGEAEVMIGAGIRDVLVTKEIVQSQEIARAAELARDSEIMVVVDDGRVVEKLARAAEAAGVTIRVLMEVDIRLRRAGVGIGGPALALAREICGLRGLRFEGLMGYEGSMHGMDATARAEACRDAIADLIATKELIEQAGIAVKNVSVGASSTYKTAAAIQGVTEVQPGSYLTGDARYMAEWSDFECALSVLTTVVSRPNAKRVTTDVGQKKMSNDAGLPLVKNAAGLRCVALNEEHCILELDETARDYCVGDKVELIPCHGGTTINLYDRMYGMRGDMIEQVFEIEGRGR